MKASYSTETMVEGASVRMLECSQLEKDYEEELKTHK